ncbi:MAG: alpha/beta fold hydrolase [Pelagimonas sp.]|uniref:alpha/beta fold hydrolase n=1 Tax=Pelagimonas sp. TaxID=2073170 RepID=UPI003D6B0CE4
MKTLLKWIVSIVTCLLFAVSALYVGTRGEYAVARLVTDDPSLPSEIVNGVQLHMRVVDGPQSAPTIIVLHGGPGGDFRSLQALETLSDQYRVVFYDQRGAGLSERVSADFLTLDGHLDELGAVIDLVSPSQAPIVIGHSWGAMLAAAYIGRNPNDVQSAVLIEPGYLDAAGREAWEAESATYMSGLGYGMMAITTGFRAQHVSGPDAAAPDDFLIGHMVRTFANHPDNPYHCGNGYSAPNWRFGAQSSTTWRGASAATVDQIGSNTVAFKGPVLLIAGECNNWLGPLQTLHISQFANADLAIIPDAGHDVVWDNADATLATIRAFLD